MQLAYQLSLLQYLFLHGLVSAHFSVQHYFITKPGCSNICGGVKIPYPYGIGSNCSMSPEFSLSCGNFSSSTGRPYLQLMFPHGRGYRVVRFSKSQLRINNPIYATRCTEQGSGSGSGSITTNLTMDFSGTPFTLSEANSVTQVGCTDLTVLEGFARHFTGRRGAHAHAIEQNDFAFGCVSFCYNNSFSSTNASCPGNGCCQIPVPAGTVFLNVSISGLRDEWDKVHHRNCSFSFLGETGSLTSPEEAHQPYVPGVPRLAWLTGRTVVLDWRIGRLRCNEARSSPGFACQNNSVCVDAYPQIGGYQCHCSSGYQGNPYLTHGCQEIDYCESNPCHGSGFCTNTLRGYICGCPAGYHGNGWRNGTGCVLLTAPTPKLSNVLIGLISGLSFTTFLLILFGSARFMRKRKNTKREQKYFKQNGGLLLKQQTTVNEGILGNTRIFTAKELEKATDKFNESRILGRGGQGTVYKGMLSDGQIVAIKKSQLVDEHKSKHVVEQFINEVVILSQINHKNVVKLLGCCLQTKVPLLVYEYMPNGTLFHHMHDEKNADLLFSWNMRLKIAADVAGALAYLHSATSLPIFHRDIKSSNILLDEKYVAKVSDFGTSKSVPADQTHLTTNVNGTFGYIDPEYFRSNQFTEKSDVYSFGVVLVELLTGLKAVISSPGAEDENRSLVVRFLSAMNENKLDSILDDQVLAQGEKRSVVAVAKLAQRCLNLNGKKRPNMKEVGMELESVRSAQMELTTHLKMSGDSSSSNKEGTKILETDDNNYGWTTTFDLPTNSFSDTFPLMFDDGIRQ